MASEIRSYRDLRAWEAGFSLVKRVYEFSADFPADERFGLTAQIRRAAISIPANIAEGYRRRHRADYVRFLEIALGSVAEVETFLLFAQEFGYGAPSLCGECEELARRCGALLYRLIESLLGKEGYVVKEDLFPLPSSVYRDQ